MTGSAHPKFFDNAERNGNDCQQRAARITIVSSETWIAIIRAANRTANRTANAGIAAANSTRSKQVAGRCRRCRAGVARSAVRTAWSVIITVRAIAAATRQEGRDTNNRSQCDDSFHSGKPLSFGLNGKVFFDVQKRIDNSIWFTDFLIARGTNYCYRPHNRQN